MQRLRFQVERHDQILPVFQAQLKDAQEANKRLWSELLGESSYIEQLKARLEKAEALAIKLGTVHPDERSGTAAEQEHKSDESSSSDGEDEDGDEDENDDGKEQSSTS